MLVTAAGVWAPGDAQAVPVESFVMPGKLAIKHARLERQCTKCHEPFDKAAQDRLCLACHKDVGADLDEKHGYHGQASVVQGRPCKTCHGEHKGRGADLIRLDREKFDHRLTDRPLRGGHVRVRCDDCHAPGKRFREAPSHCSDCHARKDPHEGSVGLACANCHEETVWKTVRFDHNAAAFRLEGRHREARCEGCHKTKKFKPTASTCYACHERDDKHRGSFAGNCQSCHTPMRKWRATEFDHLRKTKFPLTGRHASTSCEKCHRDGLAAERTATNCHGCHERNDGHHGQFGRTCETCHTPAEWRRHTFEHDRRTRFALRGRHTEARCTGCHRGALQAEHLDRSCYACHREDDVHHGREGTRCDKCHDERGWNRDVLFDHDSTQFRLLDSHARIACMQCHVSRTFKEVARDCASCHQKADVHRNRLGGRCGNCHNSAAWQTWKFDHSLQTKYRLEGAHAKAKCEACHREPVVDRMAPLSPRCVSCHEGDSVRRCQRGAECERCHEMSSFRVAHAPE